MKMSTEIKFNIYNPVITYEHRAAYEMVLSQRHQIFPICNQGKCKALEMTDDPQKQKQINDLMEKVEYISDSLITITKVFFDQMYRAKESSAQSIAHSIAKITIDMVERNLLERTCDVRWWALEKSFWECVEVSNLTKSNSEKKLSNALETLVSIGCSRLEDIRSSYTLYRDLVLVDLNGDVIATANTSRREKLLEFNVSEEIWFKKALKTNDGTEYFAQDFCESKLENNGSLIYSTAIRAKGNEKGEAIGVLGVLFDFQGECQIVLNDALPKDTNGEMLDGWFSFFTNNQGKVICSSDQDFIPSGLVPPIPRSHRTLRNKGDFKFSTAVFCGINCLIVSHKSEGFDNYEGFGWSSHLVLPVTSMFERHKENKDFGITPKELMNSHLIPEVNRHTFQDIQRNTDKGDIQLISINGIVLATDLGKAGKSFMPIFDQITKTGSSTTGKMELLLAEMSSDMLNQALKALVNLSKQAIELIDRNLFERAADVRWWSSDFIFCTALKNNETENYDVVCNRLAVIKSTYSMYRDLVIADFNGRIVANSKLENRDKLKGISVSDQSWFRQGIQITKSTQFGVQDVCNSDLETEKNSLIYSGGILENGQRVGKALGVLGIFFDWEALAHPILDGCIPRIDNNVVEGGASFFTNTDHLVIASTDEENFTTGHQVNIPIANLNLKEGESSAGIFSINGKKYIIGSTKTKGYREYRGLEWTAHVVRLID